MINETKLLFILAPMDDVTDTVFRQIVSSCAAPDLCLSEFVNVDGLMSLGRAKLLKKLDRDESEPPLIAHIWGLKPENFYRVAQQIASGELAQELGLKTNFSGIDLNMGCPVKQVVKAGACSALINDHILAAAIIEATKKGAADRLPVSIKTRIGYNSIDEAWIQFLLSFDLSMLSVHLRTAKEMSLVPAHYEELTRIKAQRDKLAPQTRIIANGDIISKPQARKLISRYGIDGAMIGRGIFQDPYVFAEESPWQTMASEDKLRLFIKHLTLFSAWAEQPDKGVKRLNKYAKIYVNGFNGAKEMREKIASVDTIQDMLSIINNELVGTKP